MTVHSTRSPSAIAPPLPHSTAVFLPPPFTCVIHCAQNNRRQSVSLSGRSPTICARRHSHPHRWLCRCPLFPAPPAPFSSLVPFHCIAYKQRGREIDFCLVVVVLWRFVFSTPRLGDFLCGSPSHLLVHSSAASSLHPYRPLHFCLAFPHGISFCLPHRNRLGSATQELLNELVELLESEE